MKFHQLTPELLREAAEPKWLNSFQGLRGSCLAVLHLAYERLSAREADIAYQEVCRVVHECEGTVIGVMSDIESKSARQNARATWLLFLADVLEDGGLDEGEDNAQA